MLAYKNTIETKEQAVSAAKRHREQDMLLKGTYHDEDSGEAGSAAFRGCSVGCMYKPFEGKVKAPSLHAISEPVHGIPAQLTYLRDRIFEGLPAPKHRDWHVQFTEAIPTGADLSLVTARFMVWILSDKDHGVTRFVESDSAQEKAINQVVALYQRLINGEEVADMEWAAARAAAEAARAAAEAARAAAEAARAAARAAWAAAEAAWAARAAEAAAWAAAARAAEAAAYEAMANKLLELLSAAPVVE